MKSDVKIWQLWNRGLNTFEIGERLGMEEHVVDKILHDALEVIRLGQIKGVLGKIKEKQPFAGQEWR